MDAGDPIGRRDFLKLMEASLAAAGLSACTRMPGEKIVTWVKQPEEISPGSPTYYASSLSLGGYAKGVLVKTSKGRPIKIEGNPLHPASLGATDVFMQAAVLSLYDPDRAKTVSYLGQTSDWSAFEKAIQDKREDWKRNGGEGVRLLTETVTSPTLASELKEFLNSFPGARWHQYEPINQSLVHRASMLAFSRDLRPLYAFEHADIVVSFDADFLGEGPAQQAYAREFMARRKPENGKRPNRLYVVETNLTTTGAVADHRVALSPSEILVFALEVAARLGLSRGLPRKEAVAHPHKAQAIADELKANRGRGLVIAGAQAFPELQALCFLLNERLGNGNRAIRYIDPPEAVPLDQQESLSALVRDMSAGRVESLFILDANPAYSAPGDLGFKSALERVPFRVRLGEHEDETSFLCHWNLPASHFLESWGDSRAFDGTASVQQAVVAPLHPGRSSLELLAMLNGKSSLSGYQLLERYWKEHGGLKGSSGFEALFKRAIHDGLFAGTRFAARDPEVRSDFLNKITLSGTKGLEASFVADPTVWDGRFSNNGWLQELPKPITQLTWDNALLLGPRTANALGVRDGDVVLAGLANRGVDAAVLVLPGHAEKSVTLSFGYGRTRAGQLGDGRGYDAFALSSASSPFWAAGLKLEKTSRRLSLANTQNHHTMEGRHLVVQASFREFQEKGKAILPRELRERQESLMPDFPEEGEAWAMVIDLASCIGCKACMIACQAENNIPIVGKDQVLNSREMHWIRVDRYLDGSPEGPRASFQPVPCMHCEKAPCEYVCPTVATNHSSDGLNQMVYNRCVGTRYCSNNCPYKVRRFNFLAYARQDRHAPAVSRNPEVTVRSRGVMEKCTYCVQRIQEARIEAERQDRQLSDGEVVTACQSACPTSAIVFGNKNDPQSQVSRLRASQRNYGLLSELGTRPRTTYLARLANPSPSFPEEEPT